MINIYILSKTKKISLKPVLVCICLESPTEFSASQHIYIQNYMNRYVKVLSL